MSLSSQGGGHHGSRLRRRRAFALLHGLEVGPLPRALDVYIFRSCPVQLRLWIVPADLLVLWQLQDFDGVLWIGWRGVM